MQILKMESEFDEFSDSPRGNPYSRDSAFVENDAPSESLNWENIEDSNFDLVHNEPLVDHQEAVDEEIEDERVVQIEAGPQEDHKEQEPPRENWTQIKQFDKIEDGKVFVSQSGYKQVSGGQYKTLFKTTIKYKCSRNEECLSKMQLVSFATCCSINWNNIDHNGCNLDTFKSKELNLLIKAKAQTKNIIKALSLPNNDKVTKKIANKKYYESKKEAKTFTIHNEDELKTWCRSQYLSFEQAQSKPKEPFVLEIIIDPKFYCILFTTYSLVEEYIKYCDDIKYQLLQVDGTYRLSKNNYVVLVLGCQDLGGQFHSLCYALTSNENTESYVMLMSGFNRFAGKMGCIIEPNKLMSDASRAIIAARREVFPECEQLQCRFHAKFNIRKKIGKEYFSNIPESRKQKVYKEINSDIRLLQSSHSMEFYSTYLNIIEKEWKDLDCNKFLKYFKAIYIHEFYGWTNCYRNPGLPLTNNAVEGFNNFLKITMNRESKELGMFFRESFDALRDISSELKRFEIRRKVDNNIWGVAEAVSLEFRNLYTKHRDNYYINNRYCFLSFLDKKKMFAEKIYVFNEVVNIKTANIRSIAKTKLFRKPTKEVFQLFKNPNKIKLIEECFDVANIKELAILPSDPTKETWERVTCTCDDYFDLKYCVHSLALGIALKIVTVPADLLLLGNFSENLS